MSNRHYTYILASKRKGAMFIGTTDNLIDCVMEHKANLVDGITSLYAIHQLVYVEGFDQAGAALLREQAIRGLQRHEKILMIEHYNPAWRDLFDDLVKSNHQPEEALG